MSIEGRLVVRFLTTRLRLLVLLAIGTIAAAAAEIAFPWLLQLAIDTATGGDTGWTLSRIGLTMAVVILVIVAGHGITLLLEALLFADASFALRQSIYRMLERLPLAVLGRSRSGALSFRATSDVALLEAAVVDLTGELLFDASIALGAILAMASSDPWLTVAVVGIMLVAALISDRFSERLPVYKRAGQMLSARLSGQLQESMAAARTVRVFGGSARQLERFDATNGQIRGMDVRGGIVRAMVTPLWHFAEALGILAVAWFGGTLVAEGRMSIGHLVGFLAFQQLLSGPITRVGTYHYRFRTCRAIAARIAAFLAGDVVPAVPIETSGDGNVHVEDVWFAHEGGERHVLAGLSFTVRFGEHVAVLGRNGSGKSTLFDLLLGLVPAEHGRIALPEPTAGRGRIGAMMQDTVLLRGTLAENLALARPDATPARMEAALREAGGGALLARLPAGLDSPIGDRGLTLSGGERQVVGLARLILMDPALVLLDEPTAALDGVVLAQVTAALERLLLGRTALIITHQRDLLDLVDRALLLDEGRLVHDGRPDLLARQSPLFRELLGIGEPA